MRGPWIHSLVRLRPVAFLAALLCLPCTAQQPPETARAMAEVVKIAHAIAVVQPRLEQAKYFEYAMGIHNAARRYGIRPAILIAIAHQESSFKERLPEGRAGEIGITQVLKRWLQNPKFRREFPHASVESLKKPANGFLYSAWILKELRREEDPGVLPFWSFYNARKFHNRAKYFVRVNKHMEKLKRNLHVIERALDPDAPVPEPSEGVLAFAPEAPKVRKKHSPAPTRRLSTSQEPPTPSSQRWIEELVPERPRKHKDPRDLLIRSATLGS